MLAAKAVPPRAMNDPRARIRSLRSLLRMSQAQLARRSGVPQAHIARIEAFKIDVQLGTLKKLYDCLFCDMIVLPKPRKRPTDVVAERRLYRLSGENLWDDAVRIDRPIKPTVYWGR